MKPTLYLALLLLAAHSSHAESPAGHWEGDIKLPSTTLSIRVDFEQASSGWSGTIDIPAQSLRGFKLQPVAVTGNSVTFALPKIPGDPKFDGKLENEKILGDFTQGGQKFRFQLERKARSSAAKGETPAKGVPGTGFAGYWQGSLKLTTMLELRLALELEGEPGNYKGTMISLDQGNVRLPISEITEQSTKLSLNVTKIGDYSGSINTDGSEISGEWTQNGQTSPLVFKRLAKKPESGRPQDPKPPFPYKTEEVKVPNTQAKLELAGTLTLPNGDGPFPAVVLITGSGPQDRDETLMGHRPFLVLADHLTRAGIAVLRYDDRGFGKSTGDFSKAVTTDFVNDALAAVAWLKQRKEFAKIGLIGHSEGGTVAPRAAIMNPADISFIVLLAGVGVPSDELLIRQWTDLSRTMGISEDVISKNAAAQKEMYARLANASDTDSATKIVREMIMEQLKEYTVEQREALGLTDAFIEQQSKFASSPWLRELLVYNPRSTLEKVQCPVLALNGEKDLQVAAQPNLTAIRDALKAGGNKQGKFIEYPGLNHLFQHCTTGGIYEYAQIEETISPEVLNEITKWILETVR